jgi:hypothetical protein
MEERSVGVEWSTQEVRRCKCDRVILVFVREKADFGLTELSPLFSTPQASLTENTANELSVGPALSRMRASLADHPGIETTLLATLISTIRRLRRAFLDHSKLGPRIISDQRCSSVGSPRAESAADCFC